MRADTLAATQGVGGIASAYLRDRLSRRASNEPIRRRRQPGLERESSVPAEAFRLHPEHRDGGFYEVERWPERGLVLFPGGTRAIKGWPLLAAAWPAVRREAPEARLLVVGWSPGVMPGYPRPTATR